MISDIEVAEFIIILFWVSFQTNGMRIRHLQVDMVQQQLNCNPWVDQCAACSALKLDSFTLVTITFEWLGRLKKCEIYMKTD